jgi:hypothetical protein
MTLIIMPTAQRIAFLIYAYLNGSITDLQSFELRDWLEEKKENQDLFRLLNSPVYAAHARCELLN